MPYSKAGKRSCKVDQSRAVSTESEHDDTFRCFVFRVSKRWGNESQWYSLISGISRSVKHSCAWSQRFLGKVLRQRRAWQRRARTHRRSGNDGNELPVFCQWYLVTQLHWIIQMIKWFILKSEVKISHAPWTTLFYQSYSKLTRPNNNLTTSHQSQYFMPSFHHPSFRSFHLHLHF